MDLDSQLLKNILKQAINRFYVLGLKYENVLLREKIKILKHNVTGVDSPRKEYRIWVLNNIFPFLEQKDTSRINSLIKAKYIVDNLKTDECDQLFYKKIIHLLIE